MLLKCKFSAPGPNKIALYVTLLCFARTWKWRHSGSWESLSPLRSWDAHRSLVPLAGGLVEKGGSSLPIGASFCWAWGWTMASFKPAHDQPDVAAVVPLKGMGPVLKGTLPCHVKLLFSLGLVASPGGESNVEALLSPLGLAMTARERNGLQGKLRHLCKPPPLRTPPCGWTVAVGSRQLWHQRGNPGGNSIGVYSCNFRHFLNLTNLIVANETGYSGIGISVPGLAQPCSRRLFLNEDIHWSFGGHQSLIHWLAWCIDLQTGGCFVSLAFSVLSLSPIHNISFIQSFYIGGSYESFSFFYWKADANCILYFFFKAATSRNSTCFV